MPTNETPSTTPATSDALADVVPFFELPSLLPALFRTKNTAAWLLRHRDVNGLSEIVHFVGRTAYVSRGEFAAWFRASPAQPSRTDARRPSSFANGATSRPANLTLRKGT